MTQFEEDETAFGPQVPSLGAAGSDPLGPMLSGVLQQTQPWVRLVGIAGLVSAALMLLAGLAGGAAGLVTGDPTALVLLLAYPVGAVLYAFPSMHLVRSARSIRDYTATGDGQQLAAALEHQRTVWKFIGILAIVSFGALVVGITAAILIGLFLAS